MAAAAAAASSSQTSKDRSQQASSTSTDGAVTSSPSPAAMTPLLPPAPPASSRSFARPLVNLGNTCYMNAVLQALAHAPELILAMDCEPHHGACPVAAQNAETRRKTQLQLQQQQPKSGSTSPSSSPENGSASNGKEPVAPPVRKQGTRKSLRTSGRRSPADDGGTRRDRSSGRSGRRGSNSAANGDGVGFCALCEIEQHFRLVHANGLNGVDPARQQQQPSAKQDPVAPSAFVHGFIDHVAPWFRLGVQEDSHEFLRLLIDSMQKSCQNARKSKTPGDAAAKAEDAGSEEKDPKQDLQPEDTASGVAGSTKDKEYPFSLFRGTVESNVTCDSCKASSSTLDPIEDIGLEVTSTSPTMPVTSERSARGGGGNGNNVNAGLADVQAAFQRYSRVEALDSGYKCENCGKGGRATKQTRLASIPPILTLHLKRFRYGGDSRAGAGSGSGAVGGIASGGVGTRRGRSEVSQLLGANAADFLLTKSGSAKIEGHIKFDLFFDLKPFLTEKLQKQHKNMFCRLFAVVVHAGKNSHSGHYYSYVRHLNKNEWLKMDDSRVTSVGVDEVMRAEAYMLFYRVVQHPVTIQLEEQYKSKFQWQQQTSEAVEAVKTKASGDDDNTTAVSCDSTCPSPSKHGAEAGKKRRSCVAFENGEEWAKAKTTIPPHMMGLFKKAQEMVADDVQFSPTYFQQISDEAARDSNESGNKSKNGIGKKPASVVSRISESDVVGGADKYRSDIVELLYDIAAQMEKEGGGSGEKVGAGGKTCSWLTSCRDEAVASGAAGKGHAKEGGSSSKAGNRVAVVEPEDMDLL